VKISIDEACNKKHLEERGREREIRVFYIDESERLQVFIDA